MAKMCKESNNYGEEIYILMEATEIRIVNRFQRIYNKNLLVSQVDRICKSSSTNESQRNHLHIPIHILIHINNIFVLKLF